MYVSLGKKLTAGERLPPVCIHLILLSTFSSAKSNRPLRLINGTLQKSGHIHTYVSHSNTSRRSTRSWPGYRSRMSEPDCDERNQDSIPLSPKGSQWSYPDPVRSAEERGAESTNHIDRHREAYHHNITKNRLFPSTDSQSTTYM